jgi:hypothetical protein
MDIFILMAFAGLVAAGYFAGVARVGATIFAMYFAIVIAATFYQRIGRSIRDLVGTDNMSLGAAQFAAFTLLFTIITVGLAIIFFKTTHPVATARGFAMLDSLGGAVLAIIIAAVAVTMALAITVVLIQAMIQTSIDASSGSLMGSLKDQLENSELAPLFLRLMPILTTPIQPWFPNGLPPVLRTVDL